LENKVDWLTQARETNKRHIADLETRVKELETERKLIELECGI
jgi:hypothetical protein